MKRGVGVAVCEVVTSLVLLVCLFGIGVGMGVWVYEALVSLVRLVCVCLE